MSARPVAGFSMGEFRAWPEITRRRNPLRRGILTPAAGSPRGSSARADQGRDVVAHARERIATAEWHTRERDSTGARLRPPTAKSKRLPFGCNRSLNDAPDPPLSIQRARGLISDVVGERRDPTT